MRNWNSKDILILPLLSRGFILPMRNWNHFNRFFRGWLAPDLSYLWGIETPNSCKVDPIIHLGFILPMRNWNLMDSMPSIQPVFGFILPMRNWNPDAGYFSGVRQVGFILPMRNWNRQRKSFSTSRKRRGFILPMRNWNPIGASEHHPNLRDLSYLWGIETRYRGGYLGL